MEFQIIARGPKVSRSGRKPLATKLGKQQAAPKDEQNNNLALSAGHAVTEKTIAPPPAKHTRREKETWSRLPVRKGP